MMLNWFQLFAKRLSKAGLSFSRHDDSMAAAAIAYYLALSLFPLLLVLTAGLGAVLEATALGQNAQQRLLATISEQASPELSDLVRHTLDAVKEYAPGGGLVGFLVLAVAAMATFSQLDYAFDRIWECASQRKLAWRVWLAQRLFARLRAIAMLVGVGIFVFVVMVASTFWGQVQAWMAPATAVAPWLGWTSRSLINLGLNVLAFTVVYRVLPKAAVRWREALAGGAVAAALWEAGRQILAAYVTRQNYPTAYGIIGSFLAIMLWAYYATLVILFGAEFVFVTSKVVRPGTAQDRP